MFSFVNLQNNALFSSYAYSFAYLELPLLQPFQKSA